MRCSDSYRDPLWSDAVLLPFTPAGVYLGFVAPPAFFFLLLTVMLVAYLLVLVVEGMKQWFFRHFATE
jgi:Mg2+-importing ATPase